MIEIKSGEHAVKHLKMPLMKHLKIFAGAYKKNSPQSDEKIFGQEVKNFLKIFFEVIFRPNLQIPNFG